MADKRKRSDDGAASAHKKRKGFQVGPANLPDGIYKRKNQKIKEDLIERAQIKKQYAKLRRQGDFSAGAEPERIPEPASVAADRKKAEENGADQDEGNDNEEEESEQTQKDPHPDRQNLIDEELEAPMQPEPTERRQRQRRPKSIPFKREHDAAQQRKAEAEERRKAREEAEKQREQKREDRERFRKAMAKARTGGPNGQRKLGRESNVLLEKVKRMMG